MFKRTKKIINKQTWTKHKQGHSNWKVKGWWERKKGARTKSNQTFCLLFPQAARASASINLHDDRKKTSGCSPPPSPVHPVAHVPPRWGTDHGRHRLGVNRVPFIWLDAAGGPIRQPKRGWGRGRPMLSRPLQLTPSLGTLQTTVKLIKLPEKMSPRVCASGMSEGGKSGGAAYEEACRSAAVVSLIRSSWFVGRLRVCFTSTLYFF